MDLLVATLIIQDAQYAARKAAAHHAAPASRHPLPFFGARRAR
jgi:hypothetical protein